MPNMWEIVKRIKKKKEEPITAIKSKDGVVVEDQEGIKMRLGMRPLEQILTKVSRQMWTNPFLYH